jgi:hypothetical protein
LERSAGHRGWMYDARTKLLFCGIWADLDEAFGSARAQAEFKWLIQATMDSYRPNFGAILAGLSQTQHTMLDGPLHQLAYPLLQGVDPRGVEFWDPMFRHLAPSWARRSPEFSGITREFVNRARATHNSRDQPADLIDHLNRLVPDDIPQVTRRGLRPKQIDKTGSLPPEYRRRRRLPPLGNLIAGLRGRRPFDGARPGPATRNQ